jgi:4-hydroxy-2-oxoglutarate aldolase
VGNGSLLYAALELGGAGGVLAIADFVPARCADLVRAFRAGDTRRAGEIQQGLTTLHKEIVATFGAVGVKTVLDEMGWVGGPPRPPLKALGEKERTQVVRVLRDAGLLAAGPVPT